MSRYRPNNRSFGAFMKSPQLRKPVLEVSKEIADIASILAPRSEGPPSHGSKHMADEFKVRSAGFVTISGNTRVAVNVINDNPDAAVNEFGGRRNQAVRMLGRAGALFGDYKGWGGA